MEKKIGIITFHRAHNFGAMLQAFALQQFLSINNEAEILDYRSKCIENYYYSPLRLKSMIKSVILGRDSISKLSLKIRRKKTFEKFQQKYLVCSQPYSSNNISEASKNYDLFITGSDQVWNASMVQDDLNYFLKFVNPENRFSYAASFGNNSILTYPAKEEMTELISTIKIPLIRENDGVEILKKLNATNYARAKVVCDPVFLLTKCEWEEKLGLKKKSSDYIFAFFVNDPIHSLDIAKSLHEKTGLSVKYCHSYGTEKNIPDWCEKLMDIGPRKFMETLNSAKYVVTTSFHGMALSIRLGKQFYYELNKNGTNSRLNTLAEIFDLHDREITDSNIPTCSEIDYQKVNEVLEKYSSYSKAVLLSSLEGIDYE